MERRTAIALALAAGGTVLAASAAFAANVGLLDSGSNPPVGVVDVGNVEPLPSDPTVVTVVVEDPPASAAVPAADPTLAVTGATDGTDDAYEADDDHGSYEDDDHGSDDDHQSDDHESDDHESDDDD